MILLGDSPTKSPNYSPNFEDNSHKIMISYPKVLSYVLKLGELNLGELKLGEVPIVHCTTAVVHCTTGALLEKK